MVVVTKALTLADFHAAHALIAEMGQWDVAQCGVHGLPSEGVISAYYSDDAASLLEKCTLPSTGMYLARIGSVALGCVSHVSHGNVAEIVKLFVRPEGRGKGVGARLLATALDAIEESKCRKVNLVTVSFMTSAIALYRNFGFQECEPFEPAPKGLEGVTRYMERVTK
ncbi:MULTISPECIES: GNAT family N-acetyltransferase [unclassified Mesorhizobium]|uniref:GNAT family N-acetyltransferase n=1 Tax=unclassified Mesorhizobium TaxID=325217 RepID=UPI0003D01639|nr:MULTISPECIES: GNAT family N-acetyltransferase [unclassified Mesorhizobium]ESZ20455.1 GCN5 family acetyltransferase [Mesorhizobium sp. L48C026A00]RWN52291.1 MAG: GNAT family N-acetyltransferase [Mesorhizobium sp.]RWN75753.1 MAG: GNAT family N-acetyltransferase [Mesorhizobium sp.]RWN77120.1 MAG: GNAT family N-acetyltransferase [Mesorhizobium sp.]RWN87010.1 MAG: GNAT family N-acetyltransferase [Mesorhizobium sp.]